MFTNAPYKICITVFVANVLVSSDNLIAKASKPKAQAGTLMFLSLLQLYCRVIPFLLFLSALILINVKFSPCSGFM